MFSQKHLNFHDTSGGEIYKVRGDEGDIADFEISSHTQKRNVFLAILFQHDLNDSTQSFILIYKRSRKKFFSSCGVIWKVWIGYTCLKVLKKLMPIKVNLGG